MQTTSYSLARRCGKASIFDQVGAMFLLILFLPVLALIAVAIKLESPGSVISKQLARDDMNNDVNLWYFRTTKATENSGGDFEYTKVGAFLHTSRLETLPSLLNSLRGQMSIGQLMA